MQTEVDNLTLELKRTESNLGMVTAEKSQILEKLKNDEGTVICYVYFFYKYHMIFITSKVDDMKKLWYQNEFHYSQ